MSVESGVASIIAISRLAWAIYRSCKDVPKDFRDISDDASRMHTILKETDELMSDCYAQEPLVPEKVARLQHLANGCRDVLNELEELLGKFGNLGSRSVGVFDRLRFEDLSSQVRLGQKMDGFMAEVRAGLREGPVVSSSWAIDDQEIWKQLQRELENIGIPTSILREKISLSPGFNAPLSIRREF
ncbi:hypothetical protein BDD12DRAFT_890057 [Trichophaea hybrida]|nr:hypothetical protein BDD12DRAFT_890057 [Trichophaea hybrida]